jgi:2-iminobutanoate/2-iminopropanoate deaminase
MTTDRSSEPKLKIPGALGPYRVAVPFENFLFLSGQIGIDPSTGELVDGTIEGQTHQIMVNIKAILEAEGVGFNQIVKTTIFLVNIENFGVVNQIYGGYFEKAFPARSTIGVKALPKGALVEIEVIASRK